MSGLPGAFVVGLAFGWFLERGGMGHAPKLADQFYLRDLTVFKVMFSALVTAMLGIFWLGRMGVMDPGALFVPETAPLAQTVGGVVFGVGFVVAGLCPGTSCVALSSGRLDGLAAAVGMLVGVYAFGEAFPWLADLYDAAGARPLTLPQVLHVSTGVVVSAVTLVALGGFLVAEWLEGRARPGAEA